METMSRRGSAGEVVVTVQFVTGTMGGLDPSVAVRQIADTLLDALKQHQTEGGILSTFALGLKDGTYLSFDEKSVVNMAFGDEVHPPPTDSP